MKNKRDRQYFNEIAKKPLEIFLDEYAICIKEHAEKVAKFFYNVRKKDNHVSMNLARNIRVLSLDLGKYGKIFRKRTIEMNKKQKAKNDKSKKI